MAKINCLHHSHFISACSESNRSHSYSIASMDKLLLVKVLVVMIGWTAVVVMLGWAFDIGLLKSILPFWPSMTFTTALSFLLSSLVLLAIANSIQDHSIQSGLFLPVVTMGVLLLMGSMLISSLLGIRTGIENWFVEPGVQAIETFIPGRPSYGTMCAFIVVSLAGIGTMINPLKVSYLFVAGIIESGFSSTAILGYLFEVPALYFHTMALHTAILFAMMGLGLIILSSVREEESIA